ncbi:HIT family protein [Pulveribacter suum]|uniref:HIT domain-containing protein n=1 Tax=Pulveribacter suum TaxID=2116657 RepID=A0A2P1NNM1_9BURK|nr:HIT family protein [Pulveribacter suum]AVP58613.1 HIT domain-containing protein [Pulveribacter suum]
MTAAPTLGTGVSLQAPEGALAALGRPGGGSNCPLCAAEGGTVLWRGEQLRVIHVDEPGFPAFYRVVWNAHVAEFSDLAEGQRQHCMQAVALVEQALREHAQPDKVNLASLGNVVPHLHWHVIARHAWDSHWPAPLWAAPQRAREPEREAELAARLPALHEALRERLAAWGGAPAQSF